MTRCSLKNALRLQNTEFYYQPSKKKQSLHRIFISTPVASVTAQLSSERVAAIEKNKVKYRSKPTYAVYINVTGDILSYLPSTKVLLVLSFNTQS